MLGDSPDRPETDLEAPVHGRDTMGAIEINDFSSVRQLAVDVFQLVPETLLVRRGRRLRGVATSTGLVSLVLPTTRVGDLGIAKVKA